MTQKFEYSDFPSTLAIASENGPTVFHSLTAHKLYMTALEDGLYVGTQADQYYMKIDWKNVSRLETWLKNQRKENI